MKEPRMINKLLIFIGVISISVTPTGLVLLAVIDTANGYWGHSGLILPALFVGCIIFPMFCFECAIIVQNSAVEIEKKKKEIESQENQ